MQTKSIEIWVGIFVLLGMAALVMLAVQVSSGGSAGGATYRVEARFENIGGLNEKAPVMIGGVRVGRVGQISIDKDDYSAVVYLDLQQQYDNLPIDTGAAILTAGLLGAQFIGLEPGAEEVYLEDGDSLDSSLNQSALQLESLISEFAFGPNQPTDATDK